MGATVEVSTIPCSSELHILDIHDMIGNDDPELGKFRYMKDVCC